MAVCEIVTKCNLLVRVHGHKLCVFVFFKNNANGKSIRRRVLDGHTKEMHQRDEATVRTSDLLYNIQRDDYQVDELFADMQTCQHLSLASGMKMFPTAPEDSF